MKRLLLIFTSLVMLLAACQTVSSEAMPRVDVPAPIIGHAVGSDLPWRVTRVSVLDTAVAVSAGSIHTAILRPDGTVQAVGDGRHGQLEVDDWQDIVAVSAGRFHTVGLRSDGRVVSTEVIGTFSNWPADWGQSNVSEWSDIIAISAGHHHTVGLRSDGTVVATAVEHRDDGQSNVADWQDIVAISAGMRSTVGLRADGTVVATGDNWDSQLDVSEWRNIVAISAEGAATTVGLRSDGRVVAAGNNFGVETNFTDWYNIIAVSANFGLRSDGTIVVSPGLNPGWPLYNVDDWYDIIAISAGQDHTVGLKADGTVIAVGDNAFGQLGYIYLDGDGEIVFPREPPPLVEVFDVQIRESSEGSVSPQIHPDYFIEVENHAGGAYTLGQAWWVPVGERIPLRFELPEGFYQTRAITMGNYENVISVYTFSYQDMEIHMDMRYSRFPFDSGQAGFESFRPFQVSGHNAYHYLGFDGYHHLTFDNNLILYYISGRSKETILLLAQAIIGS